MPRMRDDEDGACHGTALLAQPVRDDEVASHRSSGVPRLRRTILLTNIRLTERTGTEVVTEQLAAGLRRRGHDVLVFSPSIGPLGISMAAHGVQVTDRVAGLRRPDIVHAHHTAPAMAALVAHPGVPGIFVSHDATAPFDAAPPHPRLRRILAVDERCRARLVAEGLPASSVGLLPNAVDLARIPPRPRSLPDRPARAVALTKHGAHLTAIRAACAAAGIALETYGSGPGRMTDAPEALFAEADLVFATARTALEAAAAGAGVVVCDARGCAGFLTGARAEAWLPWNLGAGILTEPPEEGPIAAAIAEWSAAEAVAATAIVRARHDFERTLDRIEALYAEVLAEPFVPDPTAEAAATAAFITGWVPGFDLQAPWRRLAEAVGVPPHAEPVERLRAEVAALSGQVQHLAAVQAGAVAAVHADAAARAAEAAALHAALAAVGAEARALRAETQAALARNEAWRATTEVALARSEAWQHRGPLRRLRDGVAALWREVVPHAIRAPLWRWRTGRRDQAP